MIPLKESFIRSDTTIIRERTVPVYVPGSNVAVDLDSLGRAWGLIGPTMDQEIFVGDEPPKETARRIVSVIDPKQQTRLTIFYDSLTKQMLAYCETIGKTYEAKIQERERIIKEQRNTIVKQKESFAQEIKNVIKYTISGLLFLALIVVGVRFILPRMRA